MAARADALPVARPTAGQPVSSHAVVEGHLMFVRQSPTGPATTPDPVPAWMAGAGSGVSPRQATVEARTRHAADGRHRLPPDRTRGSIPILGERSAAPPSPSSLCCHCARPAR